MINKEALERELRARMEKEGWYQIPLAALGVIGAVSEGGQAYNDFKEGNYGKGALHAGLAGLNVVAAPISKAVTWLPKMLNARKFLAEGEKVSPKLVAKLGKGPWYSKLWNSVSGHGSINKAEELAGKVGKKSKLNPALTDYKSSMKSTDDIANAPVFHYEHKFNNKVGPLTQLGLFMGPQFIPGFYPSESAEQGVADASQVPTRETPPVPTRNVPQVPSRHTQPSIGAYEAGPYGSNISIKRNMHDAFQAKTYADYLNYQKRSQQHAQ